MITISYVDKMTKDWVEDTGGISVTVEQSTFRQDLIILYIDATIIGTEKLIIKSAAKDTRIPVNKVFYDAVLTDEQINQRIMKITESGTFRVPIPVTVNEEEVQFDLSLDGGNASAVNVWVIPGSFKF